MSKRCRHGTQPGARFRVRCVQTFPSAAASVLEYLRPVFKGSCNICLFLEAREDLHKKAFTLFDPLLSGTRPHSLTGPWCTWVANRPRIFWDWMHLPRWWLSALSMSVVPWCGASCDALWTQHWFRVWLNMFQMVQIAAKRWVWKLQTKSTSTGFVKSSYEWQSDWRSSS